jgi:hypothetical protein
MATQLDKDITRVSTVTVDDREVLVTLTEDQKVSLKLKGLKKGEVSISIQDLYNQLSGSKETAASDSPKRTSKEFISLYDLRSQIMISANLDYATKTVIEKIIVDLIKGI